MVLVHQISEQFCSKAVTGTIPTRNGGDWGGDWVSLMEGKWPGAP
jgi:hypothetical protein